MEYEIRRSDELTHWGIKGMRWGIRRFQNKDGSLTPAGERRRARMEADLKAKEKVIKNKERTKSKLEKLEAKKRELEEREEALGEGKKRKSKQASANTHPKQKTFKDMTDDELRAEAARMQLETNYLNAKKNLASANPPQVSKGKKFMEGLLNDVIVPAAKNAGRTYVENLLKDKLGLKEEHKKSIDDLTKEFKLEQDKKSVKLEDVRREIAVIEAQKRLDKLKAEQEKREQDDD